MLCRKWVEHETVPGRFNSAANSPLITPQWEPVEHHDGPHRVPHTFLPKRAAEQQRIRLQRVDTGRGQRPVDCRANSPVTNPPGQRGGRPPPAGGLSGPAPRSVPLYPNLASGFTPRLTGHQPRADAARLRRRRRLRSPAAPARCTHKIQDTRHTTQNTRHKTRTQDTRHRTRNTRHRTQDTGHRTHDTSHKPQDQDTRHTTHDTRHKTQDASTWHL